MQTREGARYMDPLAVLAALVILAGVRPTWRLMRRIAAYRRLKRLATREVKAMAEPSTETLARRVIADFGFHCTKLIKTLDPDSSGEREVLFLGRFKGIARGGVAVEESDGPLKVVLRADGTGYVDGEW